MPICWDAEQLAVLEGTAVADKLDGIGAAPAALPDWGPSIELPSQANPNHTMYGASAGPLPCMIALQALFCCGYVGRIERRELLSCEQF